MKFMNVFDTCILSLHVSWSCGHQVEQVGFLLVTWFPSHTTPNTNNGANESDLHVLRSCLT